MRVGVFLFFLLMFCNNAFAVDTAIGDTSVTNTYVSMQQMSSKQVNTLKKKYRKLMLIISRANQQALAKMKRQETKIGIDSSINASYKVFERKAITLVSSGKIPQQLNDYLPNIDSLQTAMRFFEKVSTQFSNLDPRLTKSLTLFNQQLNGFQAEWQKSMAIQSFIRKRRTELKEKLQSFGMVKELQRVNKQVYYYQQELNQYKRLLNQPDQLASKVLGSLRNQSSFKDFMASNSQLAQLFRIPSNNTNGLGTAIEGLQTRAAIQQLLTQQLQMGGSVDPAGYMQQQLQQAQEQLNQLKDRVNKLGGGTSEFEMPDFKPNQQKTKTFLQRIEWGMNIQSQRPNGLFPVTTDLAVTIGYKLNDKSTIGVAAAYKMGWGKSFSNIHITHQGVGLRSFLDIKLKGSVWISGGYELNHQQEFNRMDQLQGLHAWQRSGLVGLSKKYSVGKKKGQIQLLWDFLSYQQLPKTRSLKFRIGYQL